MAAASSAAAILSSLGCFGLPLLPYPGPNAPPVPTRENLVCIRPPLEAQYNIYQGDFAPSTMDETNRVQFSPKSAAQSILVESGEHVQAFKVKWSRTKFYTEPVKEQVSVHWQPFERILC